MPEAPSYDQILRAASTLKGIIHRTPLYESKTFSRLTGASVFLKLECLQKTGSFKVRGAYNKLSGLSPNQRKRGVVAASAGNHAQGVAYASQILGIPCTIIMPETASPAKVSATRGYGVDVRLRGRSFDEALQKARWLCSEKDMTFIHAFDDPLIIAGQGTLGLEIVEDLPDLDAIVVPVGGGGLISGIALAAKKADSKIKIIGVQSESVPSMIVSLKRGKITSVDVGHTIADGIAIGAPGRLTFPLVKKWVDEMVTVSDEDLAQTLLLLMERAKILSEGAGVVGLAALLTRKVSIQKKKVAVVISGGNIDMYLLDQIVFRGLKSLHRLVLVRFQVTDRPGALRRIIEIFAKAKANILRIDDERLSSEVALGKANVTIVAEMIDAEHSKQLFSLLKSEDIKFLEIT